MTTYVGIDPGLNGAIAVVSKNVPVFYDMPTIPGKGGKTILSEGGVLDLFRTIAQDYTSAVATDGTYVEGCPLPIVVLERSQVMPQQGSVSGFTIGYQLGVLRMGLLAAGLPAFLVAPVTWKNKLFSGMPKLESKDKKALKARSIEVARNLYPGIDLVPKGCRTPSSDRAEALLLAHYGRIEGLLGGSIGA